MYIHIQRSQSVIVTYAFNGAAHNLIRDRQFIHEVTAIPGITFLCSICRIAKVYYGYKAELLAEVKQKAGSCKMVKQCYVCVCVFVCLLSKSHGAQHG